MQVSLRKKSKIFCVKGACDTLNSQVYAFNRGRRLNAQSDEHGRRGLESFESVEAIRTRMIFAFE